MAKRERTVSTLFIRFPLQEQVLFVKRLATLLRAGVPILKCLQILQKQMKGAGMNRVFESLITDIQNGKYLSAGLARFRKIFGDFSINLIHIGETSGTLNENLNYLADELRKKQALRRKVVGALIYPVIIVVATLGITGLLTFFVFPKILPIFQSLSFDLPWTTKALIAISSFFLDFWLYLGLGAVALIILFLIALRIKKFKYAVHRLVLTFPIFGHLSQSYQMANVCRTLGLLLRSNVPIVLSAQITANTTMNLVYRHELNRMADHITGGENISVHMSRRPRLFPPIVSQMVAVGETSGNLSETLFFLSEMYEDEMGELTRNLSTVLEPVLMVFMGLVVGFIAVSIITPIYEVTQHLNP